MNDYQNLNIEIQNFIATIVLNRPQALNALNQNTLRELSEVVSFCKDDISIKGMILTGDGEKAFVAGADIKELTVLTHDKARELAQNGHNLFKEIENFHKPVIAVVNGFALGGGCELAMACHMRVATENAKFGLPEVSLGLIPGYGGTQRLTQLVGRAKALELAMTGDMLAAKEAKELGLVNHVVTTKQEGLELANKILSRIFQRAPLAIAELIKTINAGFDFEKHGYKTEIESFAHLFTTNDFKEGTTAFLEKRAANFTGK